MQNIQDITFPKTFPLEMLNIHIPEINLGNISISSLAKENERSFVLSFSFKKVNDVIARLSLISKADWCLVTPNDFLMYGGTGNTNFLLNINLDRLYRSHIGQNGKIGIELKISLANMPGIPQFRMIDIPIQVNWLKDIPNENIKKLQIDRDIVDFASISIPNPEGEPQVEIIKITNPSDAIITCEIVSPEWIKVDPARIVLGSGQTKDSSLQIDPAKLIAGINQGEIIIANSESNVDVIVEGIAKCPALDIKRDISISIPHTDNDYTYLLGITNIGKGDLFVEAPLRLDNPEAVISYNVIGRDQIPIVIPRKDMVKGHEVSRNITIKTNSDIENLKEITIIIRFTLEFAAYTPELPKQEKTALIDQEEVLLPESKKSVGKRVAITIVLILFIGIFAVFAYLNNGINLRKTHNIKPHAPKMQMKSTENNVSISETSPLKIEKTKKEEAKKEAVEQTMPEEIDENISEQTDDESETILDRIDIPKPDLQIPKENKEMDIPKPEPIKIAKISPESDSKIVRISFLAYPRAYVYVDGVKVINNGSDITPLHKDIKSGEHEITVVANDNPNRKWTKKLVFTKDEPLVIDAKKGDW